MMIRKTHLCREADGIFLFGSTSASTVGPTHDVGTEVPDIGIILRVASESRV